MRKSVFLSGIALVTAVLAGVPVSSKETGTATSAARPWMDRSLAPDRRAAMILAQMTLEEKIAMVHGIMAIPVGPVKEIPEDAVLGAGYFPGVPRLGIVPLTETDGNVGIAYLMGLRKDGATAMPATLATGATWNRALTFEGGSMMGRESRAKGFNVLLAGNAALAREPRSGRNFEYVSEDPLLTGVLAGEAIRGIQEQKVLATLKHFAFNNQETGRKTLDVRMQDADGRETELLSFQLALELGSPGSVMCSYNKVNGAHACENAPLLQGVLKGDWRFPGWVMSDWGAVHSTGAALKGLDQQSGEQLDAEVYFGDPLRGAAQSDPRYARRLDDMVRRILRSMIAVGLVDAGSDKGAPVDEQANLAIARKVAQQGIVLLTNPRDLLPLARSAKSIAVIGGHADIAVMSGGGSAQVAGKEGPAITIPLGAATSMESFWHTAMYHRSSPLKAIAAKATQATMRYDDGSYPASAAAVAARSDIAVVFVTQWAGESYDAHDLTLTNGQDALVEAVAAANPNTIVVLETGGPVLMPWKDKVGAVLESWFPGAQGAEAIADVLFGDVNPSGHLPMTFPASLDQLPQPRLTGQDLEKGSAFEVSYREGVDVGYRWYALNGFKPLFPFGHGLSYSSFVYSDVKTSGHNPLKISFTVTNAGSRAGADVPQVYLTARPQGASRRLVGWDRVELQPGESRRIEVTAEPRILADWVSRCGCWRTAAGDYTLTVAHSALDEGSSVTTMLKGRQRSP